MRVKNYVLIDHIFSLSGWGLFTKKFLQHYQFPLNPHFLSFVRINFLHSNTSLLIILTKVGGMFSHFTSCFQRIAGKETNRESFWFHPVVVVLLSWLPALLTLPLLLQNNNKMSSIIFSFIQSALANVQKLNWKPCMLLRSWIKFACHISYIELFKPNLQFCAVNFALWVTGQKWSDLFEYQDSWVRKMIQVYSRKTIIIHIAVIK